MLNKLFDRVKWLILLFIVYKIHSETTVFVMNSSFYQNYYPWTFPFFFLPGILMLLLYTFYRDSIKVSEHVTNYFADKGYVIVSERALTFKEKLNNMHLEISGLSTYQDQIKRVFTVKSEADGLYEIIALVTMERNKNVQVEYLSRERIC